MNYKNFLTIGLLLSCGANASELNINQIAPYHDEKVIQENIKKECGDLGRQFSDATIAAIKQNNWSVVTRTETEPTKEGINLKLTIVNAISAGGFYVGQRKSVSIEAALYKDGKLLDTYAGTRNSSGGFGGGFKGSCAILERCVNTLGKDVDAWLKKQKI